MKIYINISNLKKYIGLFIFFCFFNYILSKSGSSKYVITTIVLIVGVLVFNKTINISENFELMMPNFIYIILGSLVCLINQEFTGYYMKLLLLLLIPFFLVKVLLSWIKIPIDILLLSYFSSLVFLYIIIFNCANEHEYAFSFGIFFLYFLMNNKLSNTVRYCGILIILVLVVLFTGKRLVTYSLFLFLFICFILKSFKKNLFISKKIACFLLIFLAIVCCYYIVLCHEGFFDYIKNEYNIIVSGREHILNLMKDYYSTDLSFMGHGLGWCLETLNSYNLPKAGNLHNDLLMVFIDIGFLFYIIWMLSFGYWWKRTEKVSIGVILILLYTIMNYLTDNVMIYVNYWIPTYLVLISFLETNSNDSIIFCSIRNNSLE